MAENVADAARELAEYLDRSAGSDDHDTTLAISTRSRLRMPTRPEDDLSSLAWVAFLTGGALGVLSEGEEDARRLLVEVAALSERAVMALEAETGKNAAGFLGMSTEPLHLQ